MLTKTELKDLVRRYVDELVKAVEPFTVFDVTRLIKFYKDVNVNHDDVRNEVEDYFFDGSIWGDGRATLINPTKIGWKRTIGYHLPFTPPPQIYHRKDFNIKAYDQERLDPAKHDSATILKRKTNPFNPNVKQSNMHGYDPFKPMWPPGTTPLPANLTKTKKEAAVNKVATQKENIAYVIEHKTKPNTWLGGDSKSRSGKVVNSLNRASIWTNKNGPSQVFASRSHLIDSYKIKAYKLVEVL